MSQDDPNRIPNRRDVLLGLSAGVAATAIARPGAAARGGNGHGAPNRGNPALDADAEAMADVITGAWNAWLSEAEYGHGEINSLTLEGGSLSSPVDVALLVEDGLIADGVEEDGASLLAVAAAEAWEGWAADWSLPPSDAFPDFAAVPAPEAPVTEGDAVLLQPESSASYAKITSGLTGSLASSVLDKGPIKGGHPVVALVHAIAWRVGQRVQDWSADAMVEGILGGGPVPTFAPPYVPVGPVVAGDNISTPGHLLRITRIPGGGAVESLPQEPTELP